MWSTRSSCSLRATSKVSTSTNMVTIVSGHDELTIIVSGHLKGKKKKKGNTTGLLETRASKAWVTWWLAD